MKAEKSYEDIIGLEYPFKTDRRRMSLYDRAGQFSPFAALTGYDAVIEETARRNELDYETGEVPKTILK